MQMASELNCSEQSKSIPLGPGATPGATTGATTGALTGATTGALTGATTGATTGGNPRSAGQRVLSKAIAQRSGMALARVALPGAVAGSANACCSWHKQTGEFVAVALKAAQQGFEGTVSVLPVTKSVHGSMAVNSALQSTCAVAVVERRKRDSAAIASVSVIALVVAIANLHSRSNLPVCFTSKPCV